MKEDAQPIQQYHLHKEQPGKLQFEIHSLREYLSKNQGPAQVPHSHSFYQILWFFETGGKHSIDFTSYPVEKNSIFFIGKDQIHYFDSQALHSGVLIHFNESFLMQSDVDIFLKYNVFGKHSCPWYQLNEDSIQLLNSYISLIHEELEKGSLFGHRQVLRYLLKSLLIVLERMHRNHHASALKLTNHYELQYLKFRELLEKNYTKGFTVSQYAEALHISPKTLTTIVKAASAGSPSSHISDRIILEAKRLLSFTALKVNEIAYRLGFEDDSYFVKYFRRHVKRSPGEFRELMNNS